MAKKIINKSKKIETDEINYHAKVNRPWGTYKVLEEDTGFKVKRIEVLPDAELSLQMHNHRAENWIIVKGTAEITLDDKPYKLNINERIFIPEKTKHRIKNISSKKLIFIEVQTGEYLGEDDIIRFEDKYGRI